MCFTKLQVAGRRIVSDVAVHKLTYGAEERERPLARALEAKAIAAYVRKLVERTRAKVRDSDARGVRPVGSTTSPSSRSRRRTCPLVRCVRRGSVPYSMSGGVLFATDPLHQQFLLGLRAIGDRNDGVAEAALMRPPFFAIDLLDLIRDRAHADDTAAKRAATAREWLRETTRHRFERSPGTPLGPCSSRPDLVAPSRSVQTACNGFATCTNFACSSSSGQPRRASITTAPRPVCVTGSTIHRKIEPPRPLAGDAVQVLTVHKPRASSSRSLCCGTAWVSGVRTSQCRRGMLIEMGRVGR